MTRVVRQQPGSDTAGRNLVSTASVAIVPSTSTSTSTSTSSTSQRRPSSPIMSNAARPRIIPNYTMPASNDNNAQAAGLMGSSLYSNSNIWSSLSNARDRPIGSRDSNDQPSGSSALNANSEADVWGSGLWNSEVPARSSSNSPGRTRDALLNMTNGANLPNGTGLFDPSRMGLKQNTFGPNGYSDENALGGYPPRNLSPETYRDPIASFTRDNMPPSRQSQGSPAYGDLYRGHTPSNSIQSQRPMPAHAASIQQHQAANQRAFNLNSQIGDDLALQFSRRATLENTMANGATSFNPASQPFQMNPNTQPWVNDTAARINGVDLVSDPLAASFQPLRRESVERASPVPNYRVDAGNNSPRNYMDSWMSRQTIRDPRTVEPERRTNQNPYAAPPYPYFPNQYSYQNLLSQYHPGSLDPYVQSMRHPIVPGFGLPIHPSYAPSLNIPIRTTREQDPGRGVRSVLLDEFRLSAKSSKRFELKDIYDHVVEFSGDQHGSRFIQQKLETANSDEKEQVFREIEPNAIQLMKDVFGNYVIQKFFEHGNQVQKKILAEKMRGKVVDLSTQVYACRVVQKALEHVLVEQQADLTKELEPEIVKVIKDQNGNHVVQKIIELVPRQHLDFIMHAFEGQVDNFARHSYGCRVIQRMLEHGTTDDKVLIMKEIHKRLSEEIIDQYGNYVIQHVIQNGQAEDREKIIETVISQLSYLSSHKFASNVVEKCIEFGSAEQRSRIRQLITTPGSDGATPLQTLIKDQYGNYVIQKLLAQLEEPERELFVEAIKPHFFNLKKTGTSRQLQALEKLLGVGSSSASTSSKAGSQGMHVEVNSLTTTPVLTNETNSPQSSSPPSTNASAVGIPADDSVTKPSGAGSPPRVRVNEV